MLRGSLFTFLTSLNQNQNQFWTSLELVYSWRICWGNFTENLGKFSSFWEDFGEILLVQSCNYAQILHCPILPGDCIWAKVSWQDLRRSWSRREFHFQGWAAHDPTRWKQRLKFRCNFRDTFCELCEPWNLKKSSLNWFYIKFLSFSLVNWTFYKVGPTNIGHLFDHPLWFILHYSKSKT